MKTTIRKILLFVVSIFVTTMLLSSCKIPPANTLVLNENPIFSDGIWDGYEYINPYVEQKKNSAKTVAYATKPIAPNPAYEFKFGLRNEESECLFLDTNEAYINISYGFVKTNATGYVEDITESLESYEIDVYLVNNISDYYDYENGLQAKYDFSMLSPVFTITDFFLPEEGIFNDDYKCVVKPSAHGDYYGFTHSQRAFIPQKVFNFSTGNVTAVAVERFTVNAYESENIRNIHAAYEMNEQVVVLKNYVKKGPISIPYIGKYGSADKDGINVLNYDGGNLAVSLRPNELVAKIDDCYYAVYCAPFNPNPYVMWSFTPYKLYVLKKDNIVYYKTDLAQTFWKPGTAGENNVIDPEVLFVEATSYKIETVKNDFEKQGVVFTLSNYTNGNDNGSKYKLFNIYSEGRGVYISYFSDGWVSDITITKSEKTETINIKYFLGFNWGDAHIDSSKIVYAKD